MFLRHNIGKGNKSTLTHSESQFKSLEILIHGCAFPASASSHTARRTLEVRVTYSQVWWPILGICALHLPIQVHTHSSEHTNREHTPGAVGSHLCCGSRGAVGGSVPCSKALRHGIVGEESAVHSLPPPTIPGGPKLELATFQLWVWHSTIRPRLPLVLLDSSATDSRNSARPSVEMKGLLYTVKKFKRFQLIII